MEDKDKKELEVPQGEETTDQETSEKVFEETADQERQALLGANEEGQVEVAEEPQPNADVLADDDKDAVVNPGYFDPANLAIPTSPENPRPTVSGKVWPIVSLVLAALLIVVLIVQPLGKGKSEAVATVNGVKISKDVFYDELTAPGAGAETVLDALIKKELVKQEAEKAKITIPEADIQKEIQGYIDYYGSEENYKLALTQSGMTEEVLRKTIGENLTLTKLLEPQITVTDEQIKEIFDTYKASFDTPEQVRTSVILVATEAEANDIIKELEGGADFAELAKSKSLDTLTKDMGGDTNFYGRGEKETAVEEAAFKLAKDEISGAIKTTEGYIVIKLTDRKEAHEATLEEKKEEIRKGLVSQQVSELSAAWFEDVRSKATITNTLTDKADEEVTTETPSE
ncbi:peptidylprolyl isomerase [Paenibacillus anaericanus]|uniref:peptidylprolyl isomerase n=1 Tax=Paenibacillus anaericanus TaxID=170367 RepID=A0A433YF82_9BACL|nr:peptidyl-prolyl cis-trans isomerase [Paenibacillus anaericanus]RUT48539.1 peptidylprolyl isomerase [Paenibacillus anaericanus]